MTKILGLTVKVEGYKHHNVWSGITEDERQQHKQAIITSMYYIKGFEFADIEDDIVIDSEGFYILADGRNVRIVKVGSRDAFGYIQKVTPKGKQKDGAMWHSWINGEGYGCSEGLRIAAKVQP